MILRVVVTLSLLAAFSNAASAQMSGTRTIGAGGDFNGDGRVDAGDYVVWRKLGSSPQLFQIWRANYGRRIS